MLPNIEKLRQMAQELGADLIVLHIGTDHEPTSCYFLRSKDLLELAHLNPLEVGSATLEPKVAHLYKRQWANEILQDPMYRKVRV
jgi:hypothetical protein